MRPNPYRLPSAVHPSRYQVTLEPDLAAATFTGTVDIALTVNDGVDELVLNAADLDVQRVTVDGDDAPFRVEADAEQLIIDAACAVGGAELHIEFTGTLNDKLRGFYRSTYRDQAGNQSVIATTQMQTADCRRAFPCWDEPSFKAVFEIALVIDADLLAVSNGAEISRTTRSDGKHVVRFAETIPMSTYVVAFVVGPLEASAPVDVDGIPLRVIHVPGKGHLTELGLRAGAHALRWFQQFYGIDYPTGKCDMLALPDFAAGAMENLGCITFRENLLLADARRATREERQRLTDVVAHELAHMWFGDLVTMKWWNGIWLNEAFATFMAVACSDAYRPDWDLWTTFGLDRSAALETDALASTRPVEYQVEAPNDCEGMFDVLTYEKGGSLLRMLQQYVGEEEFRKGVSHYLSKHEYGNTETHDLWDAIEEINPDHPVRQMMDSWIWQPGFPLIIARVQGDELVLAQHRFAYGDTDDPAMYLVPLHVRVGDDESTVLLDSAETRIAVSDTDAPIVVNAGGHGFVRVTYGDALRARLAGPALAKLSVLERYNLVDDAWNAVVAGRLQAAEYLSFVEGFGGVRDLVVWNAIAAGLRGANRLVDDDARPALQARVRALVAPALADLGWEATEGEGELTSELRGVLVSLLAIQGNDAEAQSRCRQVLDEDSDDPELVAAATAAVAAVGSNIDYEHYLDGFRHAATPQEQLRFLYALADFPAEAQVRRTVELAFSGEVKTQNAPFLLRQCIANRAHGAIAWDLVRRRWEEANALFPKNTIVRMIDSVRLLNDEATVADVQGFFAEHRIPQATKTLDQVLERQRVNAALRQREQDRLAAALNA